MRNHQVAILIQRDELAIRPDERRLLDAPLLPVNLPGARVYGAEDRLAPLPSAREIDRPVDQHRVAVVEAQAVRAPQLRRRRLLSVAPQLEHLRAGVVLGGDEDE